MQSIFSPFWLYLVVHILSTQRFDRTLSNTLEIGHESVWIVALAEELLVDVVILIGYNLGEVESVLKKRRVYVSIRDQQVVKPHDKVGDEHLSNTSKFD